jgi:predicted Na+-dependent transporter
VAWAALQSAQADALVPVVLYLQLGERIGLPAFAPLRRARASRHCMAFCRGMAVVSVMAGVAVKLANSHP